MKKTSTHFGRALSLAALLIALAGLSTWTGAGTATARAEPTTPAPLPGHVYASTNDADQNAIVHYARRASGMLELADIVLTGGVGVGTNNVVPGLTEPGIDPLVSAHSVTLHRDHGFLFAVNAGDGTVSAFRLEADGTPVLSDRASTGSVHPTSIASFGDLVYVSSAGIPGAAPASLIGFRLTTDGQLEEIAGSGIALQHEVSLLSHTLFTPDGTRLIISDVINSELIVVPVETDGSTGTPVFHASAGENPLGMVMSGADILLVSDAAGLVDGLSTVSSYRVEGTDLIAISPAVPSTQTAACWLSVTPDGRFVYSSNTITGNVSLYGLSPEGALELLDPAAATVAPAPGVNFSGPVDSMISASGKFFYQQYGGNGVIGAYRILPSGGLLPVPGGDGIGLPLGTEGLDGF